MIKFSIKIILFIFFNKNNRFRNNTIYKKITEDAHCLKCYWSICLHVKRAVIVLSVANVLFLYIMGTGENLVIDRVSFFSKRLVSSMSVRITKPKLSTHELLIEFIFQHEIFLYVCVGISSYIHDNSNTQDSIKIILVPKKKNYNFLCLCAR